MAAAGGRRVGEGYDPRSRTITNFLGFAGQHIMSDDDFCFRSAACVMIDI